MKCLDDDFLCPIDNICIDHRRRCDGIHSCLDMSDEKNCIKSELNKQTISNNYCFDRLGYKCDTSKQCIHLNQFCDGVFDCEDRSDEPKNCSIKVFKQGLMLKSKI